MKMKKEEKKEEGKKEKKEKKNKEKRKKSAQGFVKQWRWGRTRKESRTMTST